MKADEESLRKYCSPSLVQEYESMGNKHKETLLEALVTGSRSHLLQLVMYDERDPKSKRRQRASQSCPLVRALGELGCNYNSMLEEHIQVCRARLAGWGAEANQHPVQQLMRYQAVVEMQKSSPHYQEVSGPRGGGGYQLHQTNKAVTKNDSRNTKEWSSLRKINICDLKLFEVSEGCYLEGKIVGEAIVPMSGGTTMVQDDRGENLLLCFYNCLPDGIKGIEAEPLLKRKFPLGAKIKVAEPFLKIFGDGQRGIRVDTPGEILVELGSTTSSKETSNQRLDDAECMAAKLEGNNFVAKKQYYAATESYLRGIRYNDLVPTLLSNRCQALIFLERYEEAFCDAAASLTIGPNNSKLAKKSWNRYELCREKLKEKHIDRDDLHSLFPSLVDAFRAPLTELCSKQVDENLAQELKKLGNEAFGDKDYEKAVSLYSESLLASGETVRAMLSNWALCALETMALGDVIAASVASLRIAVEEKPVYRLSKALAFMGDYQLSRLVHSVALLPSTSLNALETKITKAEATTAMFLDPTMRSATRVMEFATNTPALLGNWIGPVETFMTSGKGRGLRATRNLEEGDVVICEIPPVSSSSDIKSNQPFVASFGKNEVDDATQTRIRSSLMLRLQHDGVMSQIVHRLSDGESEKPLVPLTDLVLNLDMFPLLLPAQREYMKDKEVPVLSMGTVERVLSINTHGTRGKDKYITGSTELLPGISMMNHASEPNCHFLDAKRVDSTHSAMVVITSRPVKKGEELSMRYHSDEVVAKKWGITG